LLVMVIVIFLAVSSYYFSTISIVEIKVNKIENTQVVLKHAKQALLDYALVNWRMTGNAGKMGKLPCPDYDSNLPDGEQDGSCGITYANAIGYFPWRTIGIDITKDSSGSCLLYAVSPAYKNSPFAALNPDSYGQFRVVNKTGAVIQGALPEDRPVAVIIAPESTLFGQTRENDPTITCGSYYGDVIATLIAAYLDNDSTTNNAAINPSSDNFIENFVAKYAGSDEGPAPLNDRLITISHREFWGVMQSAITGSAFDDRMKNLTEAIAVCFAAYGSSNTNNNLPMPAAMDIDSGEYRRNVDYDDSGNFILNFAGRLPFDVSRANTELGNGNAAHIFDNDTFCDNLDLPSTTGIIEDIHFKDDSGSDKGEYFDLWQNWKDHFFYVVSNAFNPVGTATDCLGAGDCVEYGGTEYAALIIFSGLKQVGQSRYAPPFEADEKSDINNYLEEGRQGVFFTDNDGNGVYPVVTTASNDIVFCIAIDMSVVAC